VLSPVVESFHIAQNVYVERMVNKMMNIRAIGNKEQFISNDRLMGRSMIMLSTIGFGTIGMFSKFAYASGIDAPLLLALRFLVAAVALWFYFLIFNREGIRISRKELFTCAALGLAGYGIFSTLLFKAFETTPASIVSLLFFSYPVFALILDWIVTKERPDAQLWISTSMILCGISVGVIGSLTGGFHTGMLLAIFGALWYAVYVIATRRLLVNLKPQTVGLYVISFAALGFWLMGGPITSRLHLVTGWAWIAVLAIGLVSTVMALLSFFSGLDKLGSAEASQIGTFELIVSLSLAAFVLGERVSLPLLLGAGFILFGIVMGQLKSSDRPASCGDDVQLQVGCD
jgi:drug/metabolite transporter (DMT)-like permease